MALGGVGNYYGGTGGYGSVHDYERDVRRRTMQEERMLEKRGYQLGYRINNYLNGKNIFTTTNTSSTTWTSGTRETPQVPPKTLVERLQGDVDRWLDWSRIESETKNWLIAGLPSYW